MSRLISLSGWWWWCVDEMDKADPFVRGGKWFFYIIVGHVAVIGCFGSWLGLPPPASVPSFYSCLPPSHSISSFSTLISLFRQHNFLQFLHPDFIGGEIDPSPCRCWLWWRSCLFKGFSLLILFVRVLILFCSSFDLLLILFWSCFLRFWFDDRWNACRHHWWSPFLCDSTFLF